MTTDLESILARMKSQQDMTLERCSAMEKLWYAWSGWSRFDFAASLLDLVQRQDGEIAYYKGHCESQVSLVESFRAERDALKEELKCSVASGDRIYEDYVLNQGCAGKYFAREKRLREALGDAEQSLHTLATSAGKEEALLGETAQIRGYANSRATAAKAILEDKS